jgi:putative ABC transport system permease protein
VIGGVIGVTLGAVFATAVSYFSPITASLEPWSIVLGIGITAVVGLFFGLYPAARAASLDPIEALRKE